MKTIKHISFNEIILIPAKDRFEEDYPLSHYVGHLNGSNGDSSTNVDVLIFNCSNIIEIIGLINLEIEDLKEYIATNPEVKEIYTQIEVLSKLKGDIENQCVHHDPPPELIDYLSHEKKFYGLDRNNVLFLSGVSSLVEV